MEGSAGERTASELEWLRVHAYLQQHRHELAVHAADRYPAGARVVGTPLLAPPSWRPAAPIPLDGVRLVFRPDAPAPRITDAAAVSPALFPRRPDGTPYRRHSEVVRELAAPAVFENRTTYRLTAADLAVAEPRLDFTLARYFDGVDIGGAAAHEYAAREDAAREYAADERARREPTSGPGQGKLAGQDLRAALGDPCDLAAHPATMAIAALTLRHDRAAGTASFPMHWRDPARVGHAGGMFQVIPVGIFQPSGEAAWNVRNDFSLWRGALREYAEELLGADEEHGSETAPIDYASWPLARRMTDALNDGRIRAWCLGLGTDPLTFAMDLLTVVVIDAPLYDDLFGGAVADNAEGTVLPLRPFTQESVDRLLGEHPVQAAGAALLTLARAHASVLLGALPAALAPLFQVGALRAERGVLAVSRVHPRLVRQRSEELFGHVLVQRLEALGVLLRVADAAGEEAVSAEQVPLRLVRVQERDAAGRVADQVDRGQRHVAELDRPAVLHEFVGRHRDARRVQRVRDGGRASGGLYLGERPPVVAVLVRRDDLLYLAVADHLQQSFRLGGRVDQERLAGARAPQQVGVVVHRADGDLRDGDAVDLPRLSGPAD
jgi:hypothetical protein